jgi:hypothetical protein
VSLVSDALRKARREAEGRGAARPSRPRFFFGGGVPMDSRLGTGLVLGALIAIAAAVVGAVVAVWLIGGGMAADGPAASAGVASEPPREAASGPRADAAAALPEAGPGVHREVGEQSTVTVPSSGLASDPVAPAVVPDEGMAPREAGVREPRATPVPTPTPPGPREFVGVAELGDVTLTLGYLVYRTTDPFAQINGIDVQVGSIIEGFAVDEITRDRVILHDDDGRVVIRVR